MKLIPPPKSIAFFTARILLFFAIGLTGCVSPVLPSPTLIPPVPSVTTSPTAVPSLTPSLPPTTTFTPAPTGTATPVPFYLPATVWPGDPQVAVLLYHRFIPDKSAPYSTTVKTRLGDFRSDLERLYAAGYSLIPLEDWLNGKLVLPAGRRPLILTMDDLFFADQIFLEPDGTPATDSGIGVLWQFSQQHPDFGFSIALFPNLGDKYYGNIRQNNWYGYNQNWKADLAKVIVWCIEHNAMVYNHTYNHPRLDLTPSDKLLWELSKNDDTLNSYLDMAGRSDLKAKLGNLVALPFSIWPATPGAVKVFESYVSPEGKPIQAIFEADYAVRPHYMPAPYLPAFDKYHLPRMEGLNDAVVLLETKKDLFPPVSACQVGPLDPAKQGDPAYLASQVSAMVKNTTCQPGVYALGGLLFRASSQGTEPIK